MEDISQYGQENFSMPHDVVQLPSRGIFYKNKKSSVKVGYLTAADENILMGRSEDVTMQLLRNKLYEPGMKPEELLEGDIEAILIFLRNTSFGPEMEMSLKDPVTGNEFKTQVLLDELNINKGAEPDTDGTFSATLPVSGAQVKLKMFCHFELFNFAKSLGDKLIVGLDSDEKISNDKGKDRPYNKLEDRVYALESLKAIDK